MPVKPLNKKSVKKLKKVRPSNNPDGRPAFLLERVRVTISLEAADAAWLAAQPGGRSAAVRRLVQEARTRR